MSGPSVWEKDGQWWYADETWAENGPYVSQDDATFAQHMYVRGALNDQPPPEDPEMRKRCEALRINLTVWQHQYDERHPSTMLHKQVRAFHRAFCPEQTRETPGVPDVEMVRLRMRLIAEEFFELVGAATNPALARWLNGIHTDLNAYIATATVVVDLPKFVDATHDIDYVVEGTRIAFGVNGLPVADEVQRSNMSKVGGHRREDGKWIKPPSYSPADVAGELRKQGWQG